jgi:hypothetical protein
MGLRGKRRVEREFTFAARSEQYQQLFETLTRRNALGKPKAAREGALA